MVYVEKQRSEEVCVMLAPTKGWKGEEPWNFGPRPTKPTKNTMLEYGEVVIIVAAILVFAGYCLVSSVLAIKSAEIAVLRAQAHVPVIPALRR